MVVAANMAFAHVKGVARDPKDYEVYKPKIITKEVIKEVPIEVEKIVEKIVEKNITHKIPKHLKQPLEEAIKHARRRGEDVSMLDDRFFED